MRKQKVLTVCLCGLLLLAGLWRNGQVQEVSAPAEAGRMIALTFDDGPHPVYTRQLLDGLRERGVKATFFLIGQNVEGNEELVRQMAEDGHLIGCHTESHVDLTRCTQSEARREIEEASRRIARITGEEVRYIRPPFGNWSEALAEDFPLTVVKWTVDPEDWKVREKEEIVRRVLEKTQDGSVILLHDVYPASVEAALEAVDRLQAEGYQFVTVEELLLD